MNGRRRSAPWKIESRLVPRELLDGLPKFTDPVEKIKPHESLLFRPLTETFEAPTQMSCDWRTTGVLNPPASQGGCNTCTSFAIVAAVEALHFLKAKTRIKLAPGFIHSCLLGKTCYQGASVQEALNASAAHGIALGFPGDYPYPTSSCSTSNLYRVGQRVRLSSPNEAMVSLLNHGPIVADMFIDPSFIDLAPGAIYRLQDPDRSRLHSVCVVGFHQRSQYWIVLNSYGPNWSDGGFGRIGFGSGGLLSARAGWQVVI